MIIHVNRDACAGIALAVFGVAIAIYSYMHYPIGAISRMGPGMFPLMLGCALFAVAVGILLVSLVRPSEAIEINVRSGALVLVSLASFAVIVRPFGVVPALLAVLFVSSIAVPGRRPVGTAVFSAAVTAGIVFIFVYLMDLNLNLFRWPA